MSKGAATKFAAAIMFVGLLAVIVLQHALGYRLDSNATVAVYAGLVFTAFEALS